MVVVWSSKIHEVIFETEDEAHNEKIEFAVVRARVSFGILSRFRFRRRKTSGPILEMRRETIPKVPKDGYWKQLRMELKKWSLKS